MTDIREQRTAVLAAAAKAKSKAKTKAAEEGIAHRSSAVNQSTSKASNVRPASPTPSSTGTLSYADVSNISARSPVPSRPSPPRRTARTHSYSP